MIDELTTAGTETQLVALIRGLDRTIVEPSLCLLRGEDEQSRALEPEDCPVLRLGLRSFRHPSTVRNAWRLARFLREQRTDVFQVYFPESTYFGVPIARFAGVKYLLRTRNNLGYWMTPWHRRLSRCCAALSDGLIANCAASRDAVVADEGLALERVVVLENGVDLSRFSDWEAQPGNHRVGVIANLRRVKGLDSFLRAAALLRREHPKVMFAIGGEGPERPMLEHLAREIGLADSLDLLGAIHDVPGFLAGLDVTVLPSLSEGMSNALLEYMAAGRAIVATDVGNNATMIEDEVTGLIVPPNDSNALAGAIGRLLNDPHMARRLGVAARRRVETDYSREVMVRRFEAYYRGLVGGTR
jgi:glycosyltransferase involved in cell wall biosynthesis